MPRLTFTDDTRTFALESDDALDPAAALQLLARLTRLAADVTKLALRPAATSSPADFTLDIAYATGRQALVSYTARPDVEQSSCAFRLDPRWTIAEIRRLLDALAFLITAQLAMRITSVEYDAPAPPA